MRSFARFLPMLAAGLLAISPAVAQQSSFNIELNNLEPVDGGCRLTFVAQNQTGVNLSRTSYDVAVFDDGGAVSDRLILEFGELPGGKTRVVQFLLNRSCTALSRLLLNGAEECTDESGAASRVCMDALAPSSRVPVSFGS
ncbi:hypothetical protein ROE7235_02089 [Roseibaca ekhonensis]|uniref:Tat pathway signal sequence domain protein n=1 Tax=Roseinatronobacter ekhonensis TaxID=254356 RepID=A0A3B0M9J7_9RHOB|nr:hypothetical protein [Roseibaca ekhonensis]SUZ32333.1 hypothetical protein ROE7235_02089 [Roseibaca ekhonensis]